MQVVKYNFKVKQARVKMGPPKDNNKLNIETSKCSKKFPRHSSTNQYVGMETWKSGEVDRRKYV